MNKTSKLDAILNAWLEFISLVDLNNAKVPGNTAVMSGVELVGDYVQINRRDFSNLKRKVSEEMGQGETIWVLSFPQLSTVGQGKSEYYPLFSLDVTSILKGEYQEGGWNLDNLELVEAGENLAQFLKLEDVEREQLNTEDGLAQFLRSTFKLQHFETYEGWMNQVSMPPSYKIERKPYLFPFQGSNFNKHLKQDLKDIQSNPRNWLISKHPADEYLFGTPQPPAHKIKYTGAFPTHPPAYSQLKALKHAQTEPITAVQGPPGSGKTTLILHVIAQQVVKRALSLIETGEDINNLTVVSSAINKPVENVIEKLDEYFQNKPLQDKFFYLKGGSRNNINSPGAAKELLQSAIVDFLDKNRFDGTIFNSLAEEIKELKADLTIQENHYVNMRRQRDLDETQQPKLQRKTQELELELENSNAAQNRLEGRAVALELYTQLPIDLYKKIKVIFNNAESELPGSSLPWWRRFLLWLTRRTERQILVRTASRCEKYILQTFDTPFPIENPTSRSILTQQAGFVRTRLERARELQDVKNQLREVSENINRFGSERDAVLTELTALESRLATEIRDFYDYFHLDYHEEHKRLFELARQFLNQQALRNKENVKKALTSYSKFVMGNDITRKTFSENLESLEENLKAISLIFPVITCTLLSVRNMLPCISECVDRIIVDEAGMIPQHQTFPLLVRSRRAIIVGDPLQIEPIISLTDQRRVQYHKTAFIDRRLSEIDYHRYSPEQIECATTYHRSAGASGEDGDAGQGIRLIEHFRCQPSIIQFCDRIVGYGLEVKTPPVSIRFS